MMWGPGFGWNGIGWGGSGWLGMLFSSFVMLAFFGGLIVLGFFAVRALTSSGSGQNRIVPANSTRALDILGEHYARGDITKEQYEEIKRDLTS